MRTLIGKTAGRCLDFISALQTISIGHAGPTWEAYDQRLRELVYKVITLDENGGNEDYLQSLLVQLRKEWRCYLGEDAALKIGLATRGLLDG